MNTLERYIAEGERAHGAKFDPSDMLACEPVIRHNFLGPRVKVSHPVYGVRSGRVSKTTGWKPALLLMHRSSDHGSSDLLGPLDRVIAVHDGRSYVEIVPTP